MDEKDAEIIKILKQDSRTPYTEVAKKIGASEGTVRNRVQKLIDNDVIRRFTLSTSEGNLRAIIEVKLDIHSVTSDVSNEIKQWSSIDYVWEMSGEDDLIIVVDVKDTSEINDIITDVRKLEATEETNTRLILDEKI